MGVAVVSVPWNYLFQSPDSGLGMNKNILKIHFLKWKISTKKKPRKFGNFKEFLNSGVHQIFQKIDFILDWSWNPPEVSNKKNQLMGVRSW